MKKIIAILALIILTQPLKVNALAERVINPNVSKSAILYFEELNPSSTSTKIIDINLSPGQSINAVITNITFNPGEINIAAILSGQSFCDLFIDKSFDNTTGTINIACLKPYPGQNEKGLVAQIILNKINVSNASLTFSKDSMVLANNGLGTNILATTSSITF